MRHLIFPAAVGAALGLATLVAQTQNAPAQQPKPTADPYANNPNPGAAKFPLAAPAGKDSNAIATPPPGAVNQGALQPRHLEVRAGVHSAAWNQGLESGQAQDDAGRKGHRGNRLRCDGPFDVLRDGQRRLRLHLDRDAARSA